MDKNSYYVIRNRKSKKYRHVWGNKTQTAFISLADKYQDRETAEAVTKICELSDVWEVALVTVQITTEAPHDNT